MVAGAVAEAVAEAVQEAVHDAVHDAVQQAIEENVQASCVFFLRKRGWEVRLVLGSRQHPSPAACLLHRVAQVETATALQLLG